MGSTCLLVWTSALLAQLALRLRADSERTELPLRMPGFPWLTGFGLLILAAIFTVGFIGEDSRPQLLSTFSLVARPDAPFGALKPGVGSGASTSSAATRVSPTYS